MQDDLRAFMPYPPHLLALSGIKNRTASVGQKLLDSGACFIGKTHTSELVAAFMQGD